MDVVPRERLVEAALSMAQDACKRDDGVNKLFKRMIDAGHGKGWQEALTYEVDHALEAYLKMGKAGSATRDRLSSQFSQRPASKL